MGNHFSGNKKTVNKIFKVLKAPLIHPVHRGFQSNSSSTNFSALK